MLYNNKSISFAVCIALVFTSIDSTYALLQQQVELQNEPSTQARIIDSPEQNISKIKNLSAFFSTMFSMDNTFRFIGDDMFIKNQCLRADILTVHRSLDAISDNILDNYRTLTESQLQLQQNLYQELNAELIFLRNVDLLLNDDKTAYDLTENSLDKLRIAIENKVPRDFISKLPLFFNIWIESYQARFETYLNCPNAWQSVNQRVKNIVNTAEQISKNSSDFADAFTGLGQTITDTPGAFWDNSTSTIASSFLNSYNQTRLNFNNSISKVSQQFDLMKQDRQRFLNEYREVSSARYQDLSSSQQAGTSLIGITQNSLNSLARRNQDSLFATQSTELLVTSVFNDSANLLVLDNLIDLNANLEAINQTLTADGIGVNNLVNEVSTLQCR